MSVFFTSDLHLGHEKVAALRGYASAAEHDEALAERWRRQVRHGDEVWILGDVTGSTSKRVVEAAQAFLWDRLTGIKHLILGNHDAAHPMYRDAHKRQGDYWAFDSIAPAARRRVNGAEVLLSHFPYERDRGETRHAQWRLRDEGLPLLHGHTHGTERLTLTTDVEEHFGQTVSWGYTDGTQRHVRVGRKFVVGRPRVELHVGQDAWDGQLVRLETVAELLGSVS